MNYNLGVEAKKSLMNTRKQRLNSAKKGGASTSVRKVSKIKSNNIQENYTKMSLPNGPRDISALKQNNNKGAVASSLKQ